MRILVLYHLISVVFLASAKNPQDWLATPWRASTPLFLQQPLKLSEAFPRFDTFGKDQRSRNDLNTASNQHYAFANPFSLPYKQPVRHQPPKTYVRYTKTPHIFKKPPSAKFYFTPGNQPKQPLRFPKFPPPQQLGRLPDFTKSKYTFHPYVATHHVLDGYENDPTFHKVRQDVKDNGKRLKQKEIEEGQRLHTSDKETDGVHRDPDEDAEEKFNRDEEHENYPIEHENHDTEKYPHYYTIPRDPPIQYDQINQKIKYASPNTAGVKVSPKGYLPIKNYINNLKSTQAQTFGEGENDYPSVKLYTDGNQNDPDGYDIYDKQKSNFDGVSASFDGNFDRFNNKYHKNKALPPPSYHEESEESHGDEEFVPVKMYAQVRHTETEKHLPREAAYEDAVTYDDVINAPRLREAVKTSKSQTVYTEEGYEDNAYDHAGHLKHASNHQNHGGYVKDNEAAGGHYADGSGDQYKDGGSNKFGDELTHGKKWYLDEGKNEEFDNHKTYSQKEGEFETNTNDLDEAGSEKKGVKKSGFVPKNKQSTNKLMMTEDLKQTMVKNTNDGTIIVNTKSKLTNMNNDPPLGNHNTTKPKYVRLRPNYYWKRPKKTHPTTPPTKVSETSENITESTNILTNQLSKAAFKEKILSANRRVKREEDFKLPVFDFKETFLTDSEIAQISKNNAHVNSDVRLPKLRAHHNFVKYPYYQILSRNEFFKNSPLRYAQNLAHAPIKTHGGSEFYDSRNRIHCSEVEPQIDPVPERIKNASSENENEDENESSEEDRKKRHSRRKRDNFDEQKEQPRLKGLGDHIDCFKEKYFDENPLDSPFFLEDEIAPPEPIRTPFQTPASRFKSSKSNSPTGQYSENKPILHRKSTRYNLKRPEIIRTTPKPITDAPVKSTTTPKPRKIKYVPREKIIQKPKTNLLTGEVFIDNYPDNNLDYSKHEEAKIALPNAVFEKYIYSRDPQMRLYGDVIGNIRANLKTEISSKRSPLLTAYRPAFIPIHSQIDKIKNSGKPIIYEAYTDKEQIYNPNKHVRIARNSQDSNNTQTLSNHKNSRPRYTLKAKIESSTNKSYKNIGKDDRQINNSTVEKISTSSSDVNEETILPLDSIDERRGEPRYENEDEESLKNHKKYYSPVTVKQSITPEELNVEYLLKKREDEAHEQTTKKQLLDSYGQVVDMKKIDPDIVIQDNVFVDKHRFKNPPSNPNVFDVSAFLPRPLYFPEYLTRHNISSKYTTGDYHVQPTDAIDRITIPIPTTKITEIESEEQEPSTTTKKTGVFLRHTVERVPSVTEVPEVKFKRQNNFSTTTKKTPFNRRRRVRISTSTTTTQSPQIEDYDYDEEPTTKRSVKARITTYKKPSIKTTTTTQKPTTVDYRSEESESEEVTSAENDDEYKDYSTTRSTPKYDAVEQWRKVLRTSRPSSEETVSEVPYETTTVRRRPTRPTYRSRNAENTSENVPSSKPRIVEKTSTKRKKTVITNSKRYDNLNKRPLRKTKQSKNEDEKLDVNESGRTLPKKNAALKRSDEDVSSLQEDSPENKSSEPSMSPINEESRFEEEEEEEEVIKEGRSPSSRYTDKNFELFQDPELAKEVNKLSEPKKDDQYPIHSDVEIFKADFQMNRGPKHGGNYKKAPSAYKKRPRKRLDEGGELADLNASNEDRLHGGNYRAVRDDHVKDKGISARVLSSFAALLPIATTTPEPLFEKDPGKRLYFFVKV